MAPGTEHDPAHEAGEYERAQENERERIWRARYDAEQARREENKTWIEKLLSGGSIGAILIFLIGQAVFSIVYQIINNEQQAAGIKSNEVMVKTLRDDIVNLQTPLSQVVIKLDARVAGVDSEIKRVEGNNAAYHNALSARVDNIDRTGTRALETTTNTLARVIATQDRYGDRIVLLDKRISDVENRAVLQLQGQLDLIREAIKRLDEQMTRTIQALDATYNTLQDHLRSHPSQPGTHQKRGRVDAPDRNAVGLNSSPH